ncbi:MAG: type II secretion system F family protein [Phycisphaeraceae bacterium]|nr:type II secretion system F family protein [Phycisphaeraceae bacterium]
MPFDGWSSQQILIAAGTFGLVVSVWMIAVVFVTMRRNQRDAEIAVRLGEVDPSTKRVRVLRLWQQNKAASLTVPGHSSLKQWLQRMSQVPEDAGWTAPMSSVLLGVAGVAVLLSAVVFAVTQHLLPALGSVIVLVVIFTIYTRYRIARNLARFERQFADALQLLARSLRAGHPLTGAFRLTAEEMHAPVSHIFERLCQEQALGINVEQSLRHVGEETSSSDVKLFATSVAIQLRTGGNLADMMDRLAAVIRSRIRLSQRIRVVAAQTQLSKRILLALPLIMLLLLSILNPAHLEPLFIHPLGHRMLIAGGVAMLLGWYTMNRMANLKY